MLAARRLVVVAEAVIAVAVVAAGPARARPARAPRPAAAASAAASPRPAPQTPERPAAAPAAAPPTALPGPPRQGRADGYRRAAPSSLDQCHRPTLRSSSRPTSRPRSRGDGLAESLVPAPLRASIVARVPGRPQQRSLRRQRHRRGPTASRPQFPQRVRLLHDCAGRQSAQGSRAGKAQQPAAGLPAAACRQALRKCKSDESIARLSHLKQSPILRTAPS